MLVDGATQENAEERRRLEAARRREVSATDAHIWPFLVEAQARRPDAAMVLALLSYTLARLCPSSSAIVIYWLPTQAQFLHGIYTARKL